MTEHEKTRTFKSAYSKVIKPDNKNWGIVVQDIQLTKRNIDAAYEADVKRYIEYKRLQYANNKKKNNEADENENDNADDDQKKKKKTKKKVIDDKPPSKLSDLSKDELKSMHVYQSAYLISKYFFRMVDGSFRVHMKNSRDTFEFKEYDFISFRSVWGSYLQESVLSWFMNENPLRYYEVCRTDKGRIFFEDDLYCINKFKGQQYKYIGTDNFNDAIIDKANIFLEFMKDIICNGNENQYVYLCKWIGNICHGNKNDVALYLKTSEQGIGKSTFTDMLRYWIFGMNNSHVSDSEPLRTPNNRILMGNLLIIFEELPVFSKGEWQGVSSRLKDMITNKTATYSEKYIKPMKANNINNYIINSNENAIKDDDGRRYMILDISISRKGDHKYFSNIYDECFNKDTGHALFCKFYESVGDDFNAQREMPMTNNKLDAICDRLNDVYQYIKEAFILSKTPLKISLKSLYDNYILYCGQKGSTPITKPKFNKKLKDIGIICKKTNGTIKFNMEYDDLKKIADNNQWIHELDEFANELE